MFGQYTPVFTSLAQVAYKMLEAQQAALSQPPSGSSLEDGAQVEERTGRDSFYEQEGEDVSLHLILSNTLNSLPGTCFAQKRLPVCRRKGVPQRTRALLTACRYLIKCRQHSAWCNA